MNNSKNKTAKIPKPIKVKKEKTEEDRTPQPMTHYVNDRLELIKQIFGTLKPKTIINLAPDFLKAKSLEDIEEACLHELLCISTQRLKSIINGTKCPTDTESSDEDSDVQRQDAHISLEEISSDSELEGKSSRKAKRKKTLNANDANSKTHKSLEKEGEDGQISVLELLELQARARAIRSQLALEPITKIEVDSDDETNHSNKLNKGSFKTSKSERKGQFSRERLSKDYNKLNDFNNTVASASSSTTSSVGKKVKLRRNYRRSSPQLDTDTAHGIKETSSVSKPDNVDYLTDVVQVKKERSPSPDVVPIVPEPETLCIMDSSDNEDNEGNDNKQEEEEEEEEEKNGKNCVVEIPNNDQDKNSEPEEGEIQDENNDNSKTPEKDDNLIKVNCTNENDQTLTETTEMSEVMVAGNDSVRPEENVNVDENVTGKPSACNETDEDDDDHNDDVISLEGGDLENEMTEHLQNEASNTNSSFMERKSNTNEVTLENKSQDESPPDDIISLDSSEDDHSKDAESWRSRYMRSSKVNKVLLASRLGKRVRDKITKSKRSQKDDSRHNSDVEKEKNTPIFTSRHEDGSVEQYKELLELRQRNKS